MNSHESDASFLLGPQRYEYSDEAQATNRPLLLLRPLLLPLLLLLLFRLLLSSPPSLPLLFLINID